MKIDYKKTLNQLEGKDWGSAPNNAPPYVKEIYQLRSIPLVRLTAGDLTLLVRQNIGVEYILPLAIELLRKDPLILGRDVCGDLLSSVLRINNKYYNENHLFKQQVKKILEQVPNAMRKLDDIDRKYAKETLDESLPKFENN